jgi:hypothetical protein
MGCTCILTAQVSSRYTHFKDFILITSQSRYRLIKHTLFMLSAFVTSLQNLREIIADLSTSYDVRYINCGFIQLHHNT